MDEQRTTLTDDEILSVQDTDPGSVTADADGDDTDTTDGDTDDSDTDDADTDDSDSDEL
jgi:hypothetical protein